MLFFKFLDKTRLQIWYCLAILVALFLGLAWLAPHQVPVIVYKLIMCPLGGAIGVALWLSLLPYANPSRYLAHDWRKEPDADNDGKADFEVAKGSEGIFLLCVLCTCLAFCVGMLAVAWGL